MREFETRDASNFQITVRDATLLDAEPILRLGRAGAEFHRRRLFRPDDPEVVGRLAEDIARADARRTHTPGRLDVARRVIADDEIYGSVGYAKIGARYHGDQDAFTHPLVRGAGALRRRLTPGSVAKPLLDEDGELQQELFEIYTAPYRRDSGIGALAVCGALADVPRLTEVYGTVDAENTDMIRTYERYGAEPNGKTGTDVYGRHVVQVMGEAGIIRDNLQLFFIQKGIEVPPTAL